MDEENVLQQLLLEKEKEAERLKLSATEYANRMNQDQGFDREQLISGALVAAIPALLGGALKGKAGLSMGADAGGLGAQQLFSTAAKQNELEREKAKVGYGQVASQIKDTQNDVDKLKVDAYKETKSDTQRAEDSKIKSKKMNFDEKKFESDEGEKARRQGKDRREAFNQAKASTKDVSIPGLSFTDDGAPTKDNKKIALKQIGAYNTVQDAANKIEESLNSGKLEESRSQFARLVFAIKNKEELGANFTDSEQFLVSLGLPSFAKDISLKEWETEFKANVREEDYAKVLQTLRSNTDFDVKNNLANNQYYIDGQSYDPKLAERYKIPLNKGGIAERSDRRARELASGYGLDDDEMGNLFGAGTQTGNKKPVNKEVLNAILEQMAAKKKGQIQ